MLRAALLGFGVFPSAMAIGAATAETTSGLWFYLGRVRFVVVVVV